MKIICNVSNKYRKSKNPKIPYTFKKTLNFSINHSKCGMNFKKIFKEEDSIEIKNSWCSY